MITKTELLASGWFLANDIIIYDKDMNPTSILKGFLHHDVSGVFTLKQAKIAEQQRRDAKK